MLTLNCGSFLQFSLSEPPALTSAVSIHGGVLYLATGGLGNNIEGTSWLDFAPSVLTLGQSSVISHSRWGWLPPMPFEVTHSKAGI